MVRAAGRRSRPAVACVALVAIALTAVGLIGCAAEPEAAPSSTSTVTTAATPTPTPIKTLEGTPSPRPTTTDVASGMPVSVVLATWGVDGDAISASAYVTDVVEEGGTCTLHVQSADGKRTSTRDSLPTGQNTSCGFIDLALEDAGVAPWTVWISYRSTTSEGTSEQVSISEENSG